MKGSIDSLKEPILYRITRPIIRGLFYLLYRPTIEGRENIPESGRVVLAGNHTNNLDCILLISSTRRTIHFLAKDELLRGMKQVIFRNMGIIPVNRRIHDKNALKKAIEVLNEDKVIGIFPEGTFNRSDEVVLPFKVGAVKMAHDTGAPIVPFTITGKYRLFQRGVTLTFYQPYYVKNEIAKENDKLMNIIKQELVKRR